MKNNKIVDETNKHRPHTHICCAIHRPCRHATKNCSAYWKPQSGFQRR